MAPGAFPPDRPALEPPEGTVAILHVDMDAFYAAVEVLLDPTLAGHPVVVGGAGRRGVVAAASYEARAYGVRSAMPSGQARRLCPHAVFLPGHYDRYADYSRRIHDIFESYTPLVEGIALDEAFLDVSGGQRLFGRGPVMAQQIRDRIRDELGLSASVGVATSKFVAKLASEAAKPQAALSGVTPGPGVVVVAPGEELAFLHPKPVEALWGVGPATAKRLHRLGVTTIGELGQVPLPTLEGVLGAAAGRHLHSLAWGHDTRPVEPSRKIKSVSHEETYPHDLSDRARLHQEVVRMADAVGARLRASGLAGRTITLKVRYGDFTTITRSHTLFGPVDAGPTIATVGTALLGQVDGAPGVRLLGVCVSNLARSQARQLSLDLASENTRHPGIEEPAVAPWEDAEAVVDEIRARFGAGAVGPATLLDREGLRIKRRGDTQWGPNPE